MLCWLALSSSAVVRQALTQADLPCAVASTTMLVPLTLLLRVIFDAAGLQAC